MIAATILPLAAGDEQVAIALAGMLALMVGPRHGRRRRRHGSGSSRTSCRTPSGPGTWRDSRS